MHYLKTSRLAQVVLALIIIFGIFCVYQFFILQKAHSTLANYAAFRGCTSLSDITATSAECAIGSGQTIQLVEINNKWYLQGDGPGVW